MELQEKGIDVVVAGHVCLDITPAFGLNKSLDINKVFRPGKLTNIDGVYMVAAGAVPNVSVSLDILGVDTLSIGKIGKDLFGKGIVDYLKQKNVKVNMIEVEEESTSYTIVISLPETDRIFLHDPGVNDTFTASDIDYDIVGQAKLFHFGYPPLMKKMYINNSNELVEIFSRIKEMGVITSLDMSYTEPMSDSGKANWADILKQVLPYVDIFLPSVEEILYMVKPEYFHYLNDNAKKGSNILDNLDINVLQELGEILLGYGSNIVAIKCGTKGYYIQTQPMKIFEKIKWGIPLDIKNWSGREMIVETYDVIGIKSTTGAGDASIAGFLTGFLNEKSIEDTVRIANAVATQSITGDDVFSNIKSFNATCQYIKSTIPRLKLDIEGDYWKYDKNQEVWKGEKDSSSC